jgi:uridine kinase
MKNGSITLATPRKTVQVTFPDGRVFEGAKNETIEAFVKNAGVSPLPIAGILNHKLRELSHPVTQDATLTPIYMADSDGVRIYRRSLSFLLIVAAIKCFPDSTITIHHSMPFGGYYCERTLTAAPHAQIPVTETDLTNLLTRMQALVDQDLPINKVELPLEEALPIFRKNGDDEKADLFTKRRKGYLTLYELDGVRDYFHGFMLPSTAYLAHFGLHKYNDGFILQFPRRHQPETLLPFEDEPRLAQVFQDYNDWLDVIGVPSVAALNRAVRSNRTQEVILIAEALHGQQLTRIATEIANRRPQCQLVLISGPTSAGKTTFSKRLAVQLMAQGIHPVAIGMDNYFVDRSLTPRDENGEYDFETIEAVNVTLFSQHLRQLLAGETIVQPRYNFLTGKSEVGASLSITPQHVILIEGIHGLNPALIQGIPAEAMYRVFINSFTQLNLDRHNRIPTTDTRLLRRIVRDASHRGYTASDTIKRWQSVRRGEKRHIFPYQNNADKFFNSALVYEMAVMKRLAEPLLLQVAPDTPERLEAQRLLAFLQWFDTIEPNGIPSDSIVREFVGGSILADYEPWQTAK